ncbi:hypothetical protein CTA1_7028 [Colletotrichum tanaceti]|uniref:Uncharacterized protein n=1 Tax=Colletotrichum tanaceti TaxID=1306861 RepID=A0A4U6X4J0_9PEZI|nr:hypothetical protein CTA1_7028 [Colletotrichum tanaceti]
MSSAILHAGAARRSNKSRPREDRDVVKRVEAADDVVDVGVPLSPDVPEGHVDAEGRVRDAVVGLRDAASRVEVCRRCDGGLRLEGFLEARADDS